MLSIPSCHLVFHMLGNSSQEEFFFLNCPGTEASLYPYRSWCLRIGEMFAFFHARNSHSCHNLFNMTKSSLTTTPHSSLTTLICILRGPKGWCISLWLKCSITPSVVDNTTLCQWTYGSGGAEDSPTTANANRHEKGLWLRKSTNRKSKEGRKVSLHVASF